MQDSDGNDGPQLTNKRGELVVKSLHRVTEFSTKSQYILDEDSTFDVTLAREKTVSGRRLGNRFWLTKSVAERGGQKKLQVARMQASHRYEVCGLGVCLVYGIMFFKSEESRKYGNSYVLVNSFSECAEYAVKLTDVVRHVPVKNPDKRESDQSLAKKVCMGFMRGLPNTFVQYSKPAALDASDRPDVAAAKARNCILKERNANSGEDPEADLVARLREELARQKAKIRKLKKHATAVPSPSQQHMAMPTNQHPLHAWPYQHYIPPMTYPPQPAPPQPAPLQPALLQPAPPARLHRDSTTRTKKRRTIAPLTDDDDADSVSHSDSDDDND